MSVLQGLAPVRAADRAALVSESDDGYFHDKAVLITGASSGIGEELAKQLAQAGAKLTLVARRKPLLDTLADGIASTGAQRPLVVEGDVARDGEMERAVSQYPHQ